MIKHTTQKHRCFNWDDPLCLDAQPGSEEHLLRAQLRFPGLSPDH